jgi:hypothetical protein
MTAPDMSFELLDRTQAGQHADDLQALCAEVYADPPYGGADGGFADRFRVQRRQPGFVLAEARRGGYLIGWAGGSWRRQGIGRTLHDLVLRGRPEERATLAVRPAAGPAQAAFRAWGWRKIARTRDPAAGSPLYDVLIMPLPLHHKPRLHH